MDNWRLFIGVLLFLLGGSALKGRAQDDSQARAERIYTYFVEGRGDSIYAALNDEAQRQVSPQVFNDTYRQLEAQFGALQSTGTWTQEAMQGVELCYRDLQFERYRLRLLVAFDADGRMNTLRVMPAPAPAEAPQPVFDETVMEERDITVETDGYRLPGTLTLPKAAVESGRKVPCVVLVHGSGPSDRDETVGPNKPFRDLAWGLAERGIATLRYDKRTRVYGKDFVPEGREADYDTEVVDDAVAAIALAQGGLPGVDADSVYLLGHSLGGMLAPRIALRSEEALAGVILLAAPARPLEDLLLEQVAYLNSLAPSAEGRRQEAELKRQVANVKRLGTSAFCDTIALPLGMPRSYWADAVACRPVEEAVRLTCPLLVLQGERDYQVTMHDFGLWRAGLLRQRNAVCKSYPALNHLLQEGTGKATPDEYQQSSPVPAYVADDLVRFIRTGRVD